MPDGSFLAVGSVGYELWDRDRRDEAEARGLSIYDHDPIIAQQLPGHLVVSGHRLVVIRSRDRVPPGSDAPGRYRGTRQ